jgi:hypothetical protein
MKKHKDPWQCSFVPLVKIEERVKQWEVKMILNYLKELSPS